MKILVTGASGFIGSHLVETLVAAGHDLILLSRSRKEPSTGITWIRGDLSAPENLFRPIKQFQPEAVYHLAWEGIPDFSEKQCRKNALLSLSFLGLIGEIPSVRKLIITGSCREYGERAGACSEGDETHPSDWFTWSKDLVYHSAKKLCEEREIDWFWARVFFSYGLGQRPQSLIPTIIRALRAGEEPDIRTPYAKNDYVYVGDIVQGFALFLADNVPAGIYNFGSGEEVTVLEITRTIEKLLSGETMFSKHIEERSERPENPSPSFFANTEISRSVLGWSAETPLRQGLQKVLESD